MEQYINKSAIIAEIENKIKKYTKRGEESDAKRDGYGMYWGGVLSCLNEIRTLCDTLEVKEINSTDTFIEKIENYLNSQLYDWVSITNPDQRSHPNVIPKKDFIDGFKNYMKGIKL